MPQIIRYAGIATVFVQSMHQPSWDRMIDLKQWILPKSLVRIDYCPPYRDSEQAAGWIAFVQNMLRCWLGDGQDGMREQGKSIVAKGDQSFSIKAEARVYRQEHSAKCDFGSSK